MLIAVLRGRVLWLWASGAFINYCPPCWCQHGSLGPVWLGLRVIGGPIDQQPLEALSLNIQASAGVVCEVRAPECNVWSARQRGREVCLGGTASLFLFSRSVTEVEPKSSRGEKKEVLTSQLNLIIVFVLEISRPLALLAFAVLSLSICRLPVAITLLESSTSFSYAIHYLKNAELNK